MNKLFIGCFTGLTIKSLGRFYNDVSDMCDKCSRITLTCIDVLVDESGVNEEGLSYITEFVASSSISELEELSTMSHMEMTLATQEDYDRLIPIATASILGKSIDETLVDAVGEVFLNKYPEYRKDSQDKYAAIYAAATKARMDYDKANHIND